MIRTKIVQSCATYASLLPTMIGQKGGVQSLTSLRLSVWLSVWPDSFLSGLHTRELCFSVHGCPSIIMMHSLLWRYRLHIYRNPIPEWNGRHPFNRRIVQQQFQVRVIIPLLLSWWHSVGAFPAVLSGLDYLFTTQAKPLLLLPLQSTAAERLFVPHRFTGF